MPYKKHPKRRVLPPPEIAADLGVANRKVLDWIRSGELVALNLSNGCENPRYSVEPEALEAFKQSRRVVPVDGASAS